jgi:hypothetical protein
MQILTIENDGQVKKKLKRLHIALMVLMIQLANPLAEMGPSEMIAYKLQHVCNRPHLSSSVKVIFVNKHGEAKNTF